MVVRVWPVDAVFPCQVQGVPGAEGLIMAKPEDEHEFWVDSHLSAMRGWFDRTHALKADDPAAARARDAARTHALASIAHSLADIAAALKRDG